MENNYDYTEIEKYVKNELEGKALADFQHRLAQDEGLASEIIFYEQVAEVTTLTGLFEEAEEELAVETTDKKKEEGTHPKEKAKIFSLFKKGLSIAASFLVLVFAGWWVFTTGLNTSSTEYASLANDNFVHYPSLQSRGAEANSTLYDNYKNENYELAAQELEQFATANKDVTARLYAAISYLALNQAQKSIELLSNVEGVESLNNRKEYYLGLAHLQLGQKEKAIAAFKNVNDIDAFLFKKANTILETLNK